jgi:hypothetical protein
VTESGVPPHSAAGSLLRVTSRQKLRVHQTDLLLVADDEDQSEMTPKIEIR